MNYVLVILKWRTDEIVFFRNLTKIGTDENKAIYSIQIYFIL